MPCSDNDSLPQQNIKNIGCRLPHIYHNEIAMRREECKVQPLEFSLKLENARTVQTAALLYVFLVGKRSECSGLCQTRGIKRFTHLVDQGDNLRTCHPVPDAQCSQAVNLGECTQYDQVRIGFQQLDSIRVRKIRHIFAIRFIQDNHHPGRHRIQECN
ncbi:hypothetical protein D3C75_637800 [compost metagenome]